MNKVAKFSSLLWWRKRENHRKSKEIKINEPNLKLWMLFKVVVSNPFEHKQRLCVVKVSGLDLL